MLMPCMLIGYLGYFRCNWPIICCSALESNSSMSRVFFASDACSTRRVIAFVDASFMLFWLLSPLSFFFFPWPPSLWFFFCKCVFFFFLWRCLVVLQSLNEPISWERRRAGGSNRCNQGKKKRVARGRWRELIIVMKQRWPLTMSWLLMSAPPAAVPRKTPPCTSSPLVCCGGGARCETQSVSHIYKKKTFFLRKKNVETEKIRVVKQRLCHWGEGSCLQ